MNDRFHPKNFRGGFTIIELLVAVGVTALLVSLMLGIVTNITNGWNRSSGSLESGNQARLVLDQMASDLQAAIMRRDGKQKDSAGNDFYNVWLAATVQTSKPSAWESGPVTNSSNFPTGATAKFEDYRFGPYGVWLRFFSTVPGANSADDTSTATVNEALTTLSAPRAVAYQILRLPVVSGSTEVRYQMFRSEVSPDATFRVGYNLLDAKYNVVSSDDKGSSAIRVPSLSNVIANNVVDFGVRIFEGSTLKFPGGSNSYLSTTDPAVPLKGYPDSIEIFVRILSAEGAQQLELLEKGTITGDWWEIVQANSRVYTRRVDLKAKSL